MPEIARTFARFSVETRNRSFPSLARRLAVDGITDSIGCMLAGSAQPLAEKLRAVVPILPAPKSSLTAPCPLWGGWTTAADAAFLGATLSHALDYDDVSHPGMTHPSTIMVPAMLAAASVAPQATGADLVRGYIVGIELLGKLGGALNPDMFTRGWHPTPTLGPPVVALAVSTVLGMDEDAIVNALGVAASSSGGLRANFGSMTKPFHAGQAARAGLVAALLAREGFTASPEAFEHHQGYLALFGGGLVDAAAIDPPGETLELLTERGLEIKPFPACAAGQATIEAGILLHERLGGAAISKVSLRTGEATLKPMIYGQPSTPLQGKFSLPYCLAVALADGAVNIASFSQEPIHRPDVHALVEAIRIELDPERADDYYFGVEVAVETVDGARHSQAVPRAMGTSERPLPADKLQAKFLDCANGVLDPPAAERLWSAFRAIDGSVPASRFADLLASPKRKPPV